MEAFQLSVDESARRAVSWAHERHGAPRALESLNRAFEIGVDQMMGLWPEDVWRHVANNILREELRTPDRLSLTWVMRDWGPGMA